MILYLLCTILCILDYTFLCICLVGCVVVIRRSSATAEIARDADDVDYKFSEVTVHLTKKLHRIPFKLTQYYAKWYTDARLVAAITPTHSVPHVLSAC